MKKIKISKKEKKIFFLLPLLLIIILFIVFVTKGNKQIENDLLAAVTPIDLDYELNGYSYKKTCSTSVVNSLLLTYGLSNAQCTQNISATNWAIDITDNGDVFCIDSLSESISKKGKSKNGKCPII